MAAKRNHPPKRGPKRVLRPWIFKKCIQKRFNATKRVIKAWIKYRRILNKRRDNEFKILVKMGKSFGDLQLLKSLRIEAGKGNTQATNAVINLVVKLKKHDLMK